MSEQNEEINDIADVPAVEIIARYTIELLNVAAVHCGLAENGRPAELIRVRKDGSAVSLATGKPVDTGELPVPIKGTDKIDSDVNVLVVIHPAQAAMPEQAEYAIDQYLLKGGQLIAFVDPQCWIAQVYSNQGGGNPMMGGGGQNYVSPSSELKTLFKTWGVGFGSDQIVADMSFVSMMQGRRNPTARERSIANCLTSRLDEPKIDRIACCSTSDRPQVASSVSSGRP